MSIRKKHVVGIFFIVIIFFIGFNFFINKGVMYIAPTVFNDYLKKSVLDPMPVSGATPLIAHGLGGIDGVIQCNCLEAFEKNYKGGFRFFEADLSLTSDSKVVLFHEGHEPFLNVDKRISEISSTEFLSKKYMNKYTLLDFDDILRLLKKYDDAVLIIDSKKDFEKIIPKVVERTSVLFPEAIKRIIPQMYFREQWSMLQQYDVFSDIIFTLYMTDIKDKKLLTFLKKTPGITGVAMWWDSRYSDSLHSELQTINRATLVHTVNEASTVKNFLKNNVWVYTDFFLP